MSKKNVSIKINIPSDYLTTPFIYNEFVEVETSLQFTDDNWFIVNINSMKFRGGMAFAIKPECVSRLMDLVERMAIMEATHMDQDFERDQILYHEIAEHGI